MRSSILLLISLILLPVITADAQRQAKPQAILVAEIGSGGRAKSVGATARPRRAERFSRSNNYGLERQTFDLLNSERSSRGLAPLEWDDRVAEVARMHSENMASRKFFSHRGPDGSTVDSRADVVGVSNWRSIAENIAFLNGYDDPAPQAVQRWLASPAHRKNLLGRAWNRSAIGVAISDDGSVYFTQVFMAIR